MLTLCYRIEHKYNGHGPYHCASFNPHDSKAYSMRNALFNRIEWSKHPCPNKSLKKSEFCGFDSLQSLQDWFGDFAQELHDAGYEIRVFLVNKKWVRQDYKQILFRRYKAKRFCTLSVLEIA